MKLKSLKQIIERTEAKAPSDEEATPPVIALVQFRREELIKVLEPNAAKIERAKDLLFGVTNAAEGSNICIQREHLLEALGVLKEDEETDGSGNEGQPGTGDV